MAKIDLQKYDAETRKRVDRALKPRTATASFRCAEGDKNTWHRAAEHAGARFAEWAERVLNEAAEKELRK